MLRNDLITKLSEQDNDAVMVNVNGYLIDVDSVASVRGRLALILDPEDLQATLTQLACASRLPGCSCRSGSA